MGIAYAIRYTNAHSLVSSRALRGHPQFALYSTLRRRGKGSREKTGPEKLKESGRNRISPNGLLRMSVESDTVCIYSMLRKNSSNTTRKLQLRSLRLCEMKARFARNYRERHGETSHRSLSRVFLSVFGASPVFFWCNGGAPTLQSERRPGDGSRRTPRLIERPPSR